MKMRLDRKMMVGLLCLLTVTLVAGGTAALAMTGTLSVDITYRNIQITVNGNRVDVPVENEPFIYQDRTYVPLRVVSEALGYAVHWDGDTSTVMIEAPQNLPMNSASEPACDGCWDHQPTTMQPLAGWENVDLKGLTRGELVKVLGCPPHVIRMTSVVSEDFNRELWVYHPYEEDPTGLYVWLKGNVYHDSTLDEFNGFSGYRMMDVDFWN